MAKLSSPLSFTGTVDGVSVYPMRRVEGLVARKKGGPFTQTVRSSPSFAATRRNNKEFAGRSLAAGLVMEAMQPLKHLLILIRQENLTAFSAPSKNWIKRQNGNGAASCFLVIPVF